MQIVKMGAIVLVKAEDIAPVPKVSYLTGRSLCTCCGIAGRE